MELKEQAIKNAYGDNIWEKIKLFVDKDGWYKWTKKSNVNLVISPGFDYNKISDSYRPESLRGIENNNGWIRISAQADLPAIKIPGNQINYKFYEACYFDEEKFVMASLTLTAFQLRRGYLKNCWTHFREFSPKPPIY
jgi:hypothetical protein